MKKEAKIEDVVGTETDHQKRIAELEAIIQESEKKSEEAALERVCRAMGIKSQEIKDREAKAPVEKVRMFVNTEVNVNGKKYLGDVTVDIELARVLQQAIGDRRQRLLRELTGSNWVLKELEGGGFAPHLISQQDAAGERIA